MQFSIFVNCYFNPEMANMLLLSRVVVSVSTSRCRDGLETYQRLVSVSCRQKFSTSRSPLGLGRLTSRSRLGLGHLRLVPETYFPPNLAGHNIKVQRVFSRSGLIMRPTSSCLSKANSSNLVSLNCNDQLQL